MNNVTRTIRSLKGKRSFTNTMHCPLNNVIVEFIIPQYIANIWCFATTESTMHYKSIIVKALKDKLCFVYLCKYCYDFST